MMQSGRMVLYAFIILLLAYDAYKDHLVCMYGRVCINYFLWMGGMRGGSTRP
jgi:hypothetical protein